jgi:HEPN domain-containing protein
LNPRPTAWLEQARNDLAMAELATSHGFHAHACFFASQAAEKALKSLLIEVGLVPPRTHVLPALLMELAAAGMDVDPLASLRLNLLSRMATSTRYPEDDTPPQQLFDASDAQEALTVARAVLAFATPSSAER